jgi:hypothetical protein
LEATTTVSNVYKDSLLSSNIRQYEVSISQLSKIAASAELQMDYSRIKSDLETQIPKNTLVKYLPIQQKFVEWCFRKKFHDDDTVTAKKLTVYLHQEVQYTFYQSPTCDNE